MRDLLKEAKKINDVSEDKLIEYTDTMLRVFDANKDGRLQLSEMAKLLPVKENFLCRQVFKLHSFVIMGSQSCKLYIIMPTVSSHLRYRIEPTGRHRRQPSEMFCLIYAAALIYASCTDTHHP
uniref:EF-hand domain-containing protein n=1 Tax=Anopheles culicifacies TaxID=139723 RepID=A0A182MNN2_9DIPT